jgi:hypothetical protein
MATERDFELLDDYLTNRLSGSDRSAFEQKLEADPDLKNEFRLQQRLVKGIQNARIAELKGMLNNIPVPAPVSGGASVIGKFALGTIVAGAVVTGAYFYFSNGEENKSLTEVQAPIEESTAGDTTQPQAESSDSSKEPVNTAGNETQIEQNKQVPAENEPSVKTEEDTEVVAEKRPLEVFDPSQEVEGDKPLETTEAAKEARPAGSSMAVEIERDNKKYNFHYQLKGDRLVLYGPFEKNLYEIMEFFGEDDKRTAFLYYKEGYYQLKEESTDKIKPLAPITDATLIQKLKQYRSN